MMLPAPDVPIKPVLVLHAWQAIFRDFVRETGAIIECRGHCMLWGRPQPDQQPPIVGVSIRVSDERVEGKSLAPPYFGIAYAVSATQTYIVPNAMGSPSLLVGNHLLGDVRSMRES